jgi:hypothetical protein
MDRPRLAELRGEPVLGQGEALPTREARHQEMVVGVEPLGHFERGQVGGDAGRAFRFGAARAARQGKQRSERHRAVAPAVAVRDGAQHAGRVEHPVVEREVARGYVADAKSGLPLPVRGAQPGGLRVQAGIVEFAGPVALERGLQLATRSDAREAEIARDGHARALPCRSAMATYADRGERQRSLPGDIGMVVSCSRCTPPGSGFSATTAGLLARGSAGWERRPTALLLALPSQALAGLSGPPGANRADGPASRR